MMDAVKQLSSGNDTEANKATELLTNTSKISAQCRAEVIAILINSMNKPDLDFERDGDSYWLWRYGADLLGELKATEALDLLISHLDLPTNMCSATMNHMPALRGVIEMGPVAIPKLDDVLQHDASQA